MVNPLQKILMITALILSAKGFAENDVKPEEKLYAVELIIFERFDQANQQDPELWPKDVSLTYPYPWQRLLEPTEADSSADIISNSEQARRLADMPSPMAPAEEADTRNAIENAIEQAPPTQAPVGGGAHATSGDAEPNAEDLVDQQPQFVYLAQDQIELGAQARSLNRAPELRILYHKRWQQTLEPKEDASALILSGGNLFGDHYELEGSITLFLARYIHLRTNLWLTQFVPNHGQAQEHWPSLPAPPWELIAAMDPIYDQAYATQSSYLDNGAILELDTEGSLYTGAIADQANSTTFNASWLMDEGEQAPYLVSEVVTLNQARRMRSNELHYLDHPRLGLLIKVVPIDVELTAKASKGA